MSEAAQRQQRYSGPDTGALTDAQRVVHDAIATGPRGAVVGPLRVWLGAPALADRAQALGQYARYDSSLPPILSELAILVTARYWSSGFEWAHHAPLAEQAGLGKDAVSALSKAKTPALDDDAQRAVFAFAVALHREKTVPDAIYALAEQSLGAIGVIDLVGICGYYTLISMTINAFEVPDGVGPKLVELDLPPDQMFRD